MAGLVPAIQNEGIRLGRGNARDKRGHLVFTRPFRRVDAKGQKRRSYFFSGAAGLATAGAAGASRRSILAPSRSFATISDCALRTTKVSIWSFTLSNSGTCF